MICEMTNPQPIAFVSCDVLRNSLPSSPSPWQKKIASIRGFDNPQCFKNFPGSGKNQARTMPRQIVSRSRFSLTNFNVF